MEDKSYIDITKMIKFIESLTDGEKEALDEYLGYPDPEDVMSETEDLFYRIAVGLTELNLLVTYASLETSWNLIRGNIGTILSDYSDILIDNITEAAERDEVAVWRSPASCSD